MRRQEEGHIPAFPIWDDATTFDGFPWRGRVDIVTAGFPCQPWSLAGKRKGVDDQRNLWPCTFRIIQEVRPGAVLLENVPGIRKYLPVVIRDLRRAQYSVGRPLIVAAASVGAGHIRKRIWILAHYKSQCERSRLCSIEQTPQRFGRSDNGTLQEISSDDISLRQWEQSGRGPGKSRAFAAVSENASKAFISSNHNPWWDREPGLARLVHRPSNRVERIRITGNIQVPAVVRKAWHVLCQEAA